MIDQATGERKTGWLRKLRLFELSGVDVPANPGARVSIFKRGEEAGPDLAPALLRWLKNYDGKAESFRAVLNDQNVREGVWKIVDALRCSIESILRDETIAHADKMAQIGVSTGQFLAEIRGRFPGAEAELRKLLSDNPATAGFLKEDKSMDKDIEALKKSVAAITSTLEGVTAFMAKAGLSADERAYHDTLPAAEQDAFIKMAGDARAKLMKEKPVKKAAVTEGGDDESITVGGATVRKSECGPGVFGLIKAQQGAIVGQAAQIASLTDANSEAHLSTEIEKKWPLVPGTTAEKAKTLATVRKLGKDESDRFEKSWDMTQAALTAQMNEVGKGGGGGGGAGTAEAQLNTLAKNFQGSDAGKGKSFEQAYAEVIKTGDGRKLYDQYLGEQNARAARAAA